MQEAEEQDTCRICSAPAEPDQPLFHPCKCSGTIRYIHQDCLTTWLSHSKKKTCDVCKHSYSFTKVYAADMPPRLPPALLLRRLAQQALFALLFAVRAVVVALVWLAVLPWVTVWTWRICFTIGELTAWYISDREPPPESGTTINPFYYNIHPDAARPPSQTLLGEISTHPVWLALSSDIFTGQIIASMIVVTFVAIFLLREWISQNARPGVFDEEELPMPEERLPAVQQDNPPQPPQPPIVAVIEQQRNRLALAQRQVDAVRAYDAMRAMQGANGHVVGEGRNHGRTPLELPSRRERPHDDDDGTESSRETTRQQCTEDEEKNREREHAKRRKQHRAFSRRLQTARMSRREAERNSEDNALAYSDATNDPLWLPEFTFTVSPSSGQRAGSSSSASSSSSSSSSPFPPVVLQPPAEPIPFSLNSPPTPGPSDVPSTSFRRPPLPNTVLPSSGPSSPLHSTPLASPGLATYRAPEDFGVDEDPPPGYFDSSEHDREFEAEQRALMARYFPGEEDTPPQVEELEEEEEVEEEEEGDEYGIEDEDQDVPDGGQVLEVAPPVAPVLDVANQAPDIVQDAAMAAGLGDDIEANADDDMEGALEAIGMRGPFHTVLQNATLMMFVLDAAIVVGILAPFTVGKSTLLLSLDPRRFLQILHLPIRAIRLLTDPVVDTIVYVISEVIFPQYLTVGRGLLDLILIGVLFFAKAIVGRDGLGRTSEAIVTFYHRAVNASDMFFPWISASSNTTSQEPTSTFSMLDQLKAGTIEMFEPSFAALGKEVRLLAVRFCDWWTDIALGHGSTERASAIIFGYAVVALMVSVYVHLLAIGNKEAGRSVKSAFRQHLLVVKVAAFIFIELALFPLGCGVVLDLCAIWFFSGSNLANRTLFLYQAPMTAMFYHWVAGTMFMYSFAVLLSGCRSIMRSGAMWFVKDPQDQNSHPIRDILDRSTITQLRKIFISAIMYSVVVLCTVASASALYFIGSKTVLPFRWKNRQPLSKVPIDLLFLHLVLPYTMHYFRPRKGIKRLVTIIWQFLARQFRLTSYFFGGRYPTEEVTPAKWSLKSMFTSKSFFVDPTAKSDGSFRRVPATDSIALPKDIGATAVVDERGNPIDERAERLITIQNSEALKAKHQIRDDYMVVYIPPNFRRRIFTFVAVLWVTGALSLGVLVALPIALGRRFFGLFVAEDVHDGYSLIIGFYLLWGCYLVGKAIDRLDKRRQRRGGDGPRADLWMLVVKRGLLWSAKISYMTLFLGMVIPTLVALAIDLYVILPIRLGLDPTLSPTIRIVDEWALGLLYVKIGLYAHRMQPRGRIARGIDLISHNGWTHPDPVSATKEVIAPVTAGLLGMIVLPGLLFTILRHFFPSVPVNDKFIFAHLYPAIFIVAASSRSAFLSMDLLSSWSQSIRDKEFLVEMRLRNHDQDAVEEGPASVNNSTAESE
ncbi:uncharacterized protein BT62DRAFT_952269 [Guyanagaster necrorhizus]|uniref:RING-type E3 ubiquitin transferase n=1 Tax=Guyanagaster necrorhizus TaxID=856835 RepID=A0A9P8AQT2_9AGAR|nr:uncharacterized protein BT62DRAFT_952269 [Guyanagaster necrorhizus MCA 3950]KAG7444454.1 hypothetical protein BT62DRAFT_952269 [Guyanagaster necrorhizus MCA 3950]